MHQILYITKLHFFLVLIMSFISYLSCYELLIDQIWALVRLLVQIKNIVELQNFKVVPRSVVRPMSEIRSFQWRHFDSGLMELGVLGVLHIAPPIFLKICEKVALSNPNMSRSL